MGNNFSWAFEKMLNKIKVCRASEKDCYYYIAENSIWCGSLISNVTGVLHTFSIDDMLATDWELYQEPKKWTEEQREYAKALIVFNAKFIACNKNGDIWAYDTKPMKTQAFITDEWQVTDENTNCNLNIMGKSLANIFGNNVKWEDADPTKLQDIVDSEGSDGQKF